jgi:O-antigen ligase
MALLVALPFLFFDLINSRRMATRVCLIAGLSVILFALDLTNSRGAMVGLGGMATVLFIRNVGWPKGVALGAAVFALIVLLGPSRMTTISPTEPSAYGRIQAWKTGFELLKSHPFFGVGAQAWGGAKYASAVAHNSFVHCAAELGLFGLPAWVMLIFVSVKNMNFVSRRVSVTVPKTVNLFGEKVFFACLGWVVPMLFISKTYSALLYILIGLAVATTKIFVEKSEEEYVVLEKRDWLYGALITIAGLVVFKLFVIIIGV